MTGFLFLLCVIHMLSWTEANVGTFLITAPKALRVDALETVVVQMFDQDQETTVNLFLKDTLAPGSTTYASESVKLNANNNYQAAASLRIFPTIEKNIKHVYLQAISGFFKKETKIPVIRHNGFLFIQTNKPLYTPEQNVEVRVYSLNEELRKTDRPVFLTFKDPEGIAVEMIEINDVRGVKPLLPPFKIPLKPKFGVWKIEATYVNNFTTNAVAEFEVKEYVLPSISVRIEPKKNYVSAENFEAFSLKILAKYIHGEPVDTADVYITFGYIHRDEVVMIPSTFKYQKMDDGELEVVLNIRRALASMSSGPQSLGQMENHVLRVAVVLQELTGGISQEAVLSNVKFAHAPFTLSLIATPPFIKPSLPYSIRVLVKNPLGEPEKGVPVKARATWTNNDDESNTFKFSGYKQEVTEMSQNDGVAYFICNIPNNAKSAEFTFETAVEQYPADSQAQLTLSTVAYTSPNQRYLYISLPSDSSAFEVEDYASIRVHFAFHHFLALKTFSYQIISRGKIVKFATVNRVSENEQGISFKVTGDMVPSARLLVYYILYGEQQAELVADSVWFNVKAKCVNGLDVKLVAKGEQYKPKDKLSLSVKTRSASESSLLALSAVDTALYTLRTNDKDPLNKALQHFEDSDLGCGGGGGKNSADVFSRAGLTFLTNANVDAFSGAQTCSAVLRPKRFTPSFQELMELKANQYKNFKSCCLSGAESSPTLESCGDYTRRLNKELGLRCKKAFHDCCVYAQQLRKQNDNVILMRIFDDSADPDIQDETLATDGRRTRSTLDFNAKMEEYAKQFKVFKQCCLVGSNTSPTLETCEARAKRLSSTVRLECRVAFRKCCEHAQMLRMKISDRIILGRSEIEFLVDVKSVQIRSYFPESWLWQEYETDRSGLVSISKVLPDSLTTWEVKAVGLFNNGLCVADPLQVRVFQAVSVNVPLPYSMVRGEQIELKGSVYNYYESDTTFSVSLSASEGVCVFRGTLLTEDGDPHLNKGRIKSHSVALVRFYVMALEVGNHELRFTLSTKWGRETVIKTLRVVPEGIRKEIIVGQRLDPNGVYGFSGTRVELRNSLPPKLVPKSTVERQLTVNGEVVGELLSIITNPTGLMQLVNLPRGSGEVELMALLPIFYVYDYLEQTQEWGKLGDAGNPAVLRRKIKEGITSVMSFKSKREYSFSLWKNKEPSTWLTALVVKTLAYINKYVTVDHNALSNTVNWLIVNCQNSDGSFSEKSSYKPVKLMGAGSDVTEQAVFVTSFVVIGIKNALSVPKSNLEIYQHAMEKAIQYLYSEVPKVKSLYVRAITAYALTIVDHSSRPAVVVYEKLKKEAQTKGNPVTHRFWAENDAPQDPLQPNKGSAMMVETTAYMLLSALERGEIIYAKPILNWLTQDQRYGGGIHSTQDAVLTLEALTKYSILAQKTVLNMNIGVSYRKKGQIATVSLTPKNPVGKPIEITHAEDIILVTGYNTGVAFAKLRTVYYEMTDSNTNCHFDISIDIHPPDSDSKDPMHLSPRIVACAKYKPRENEFENEAGHTVMEINLPSGVSPIEGDLKRFRDGMESLVSDYEITGNQVILQMDSIPSEEFYCVGFRIQEVFKIGMSSASVFKVYEYHDPANQCTKLYYQQSRRLLRLCDGDQCQCMAAECCNFKTRIDPTLTIQQRIQDVCKGDTSYVLKVKITSTEAEGDFLTYNAKVESVLENGLRDIKISSDISLVKKATCTSTNLEIGKQYLIWGAEVMQIRLNRSYKYKFPLDSQASVEWWPFDSDCQTDSCHNYINVLYDFELDFPGCQKVG